MITLIVAEDNLIVTLSNRKAAFTCANVNKNDFLFYSLSIEMEEVTDGEGDNDIQVPDMLQLQLSEYEMLRSMYPQDTELR